MTQIITNNGGGGSGVGVYKYKGSVNSYEDLPSSGMKIGDVYNVVNEHTTAPVFPAGTNVAWTGTDWDALGGSIDLSDYQKKLVEGDGIDIDGDTNEISVESTVINGAAAGATAVQPGDDVSDLNNDAGYITSSDIPTNVSAFNNDAGYLVSSDLKQSDWNEADSSKIDYIKNKPTIGNATLTIQKNGTNVNTFTANSTSNVTANISVPTKTSDINNDSGFITKSVNNLDNYTLTTSLSTVATTGSYTDLSSKPDLSVYQTTANLVTDLTNPDDTHYPSAKAVSDALSGAGAGDMLKSVYDPNNISANAFDYDNFINTPTIPSVIDDLTSLSTTDALSANQGKVLKDAIDNLSGLGKFLSLWNSSTGQPISFPLATPYTYTTGDWFMVETLGATNYKPTGSSYTGTASTTVESGTVKQGDVYIYDGTVWLLQVNNEPQVSFSEIAGQPTDNANLATALNSKQDTLTAGENIKISSNVISANNVFIITEADVTVSTDDTKGVAPYNTSYGYTNIDISANAGIEWREGAIYTFVVNTEMVVASANRNVRVKIGTGTYIPVMGTTAALAGHSYFTKANTRQFQYTTKYEAGGALHLFTDSNTTYSSMTSAEISAGTGTTARTITPANLKTAIQTWDGNVVDDTAYAASWNGVTGIAPSKNAVYDKIQSVVSSIPTVNNATLTIQKNGTNVQTFTANQSTNATANITVPTDTSDLTNGAGFITGITSGDVTTALGYTPYNSTNPSGYVTSSIISDTAYGSGWNADTTHAPTKNAVYDKLNAMDTTIAGKQATLVSGTNIKTINGNSILGSGNITVSSSTTITVTLTSAGWSSNSQTVSATGVTASNTVIVSPAPSDIADYADCGVYCSAQGSGTLTFGCDTAPSGDIVVNVLIMS